VYGGTVECGAGAVGGPVDMLSRMRLGTEVIGKSVAHGSCGSTSETKAAIYRQYAGHLINIFSLDRAYLQTSRGS
jgi:hypothetical protein